MNTTLAKFMGIAVTALLIGALVFGAGVTLVRTESGTYNTSVTGTNPPTIANTLP